MDPVITNNLLRFLGGTGRAWGGRVLKISFGQKVNTLPEVSRESFHPMPTRNQVEERPAPFWLGRHDRVKFQFSEDDTREG